MAYPPPGGGYPQYGVPPQNYQQPQPGPYPPSNPQQSYGSPPGPGYGQSQSFPPPSPYNQPNQGYLPPPQQQPYGAPSHSPYAQSPYAPPPRPYQQPQYGAPPGPPPSQYPPQQHQQIPYGGPPQAPYGAPPPQPYGSLIVHPTPPSPGYVIGQRAQYDASRQADELRKAMKGFGTDEAALIRNLAQLSPIEVPVIIDTYKMRHNRSLEADIKSETGGYFELALTSILLGPLQHDVWCLHKALKGAGTKESLLDDVLIGRSNADMNAIKQAYHNTYHKSLESDVRSDLSAKTERMYMMIISATRQEDSAPVIPQSVEADVTELYRATQGKTGTEQLTVCSILSNRNDAHIRSITLAYEQRYRTSLETVIRNEFSGHMEDALVRMVRTGADRAMRDAVALEECMKGLGTKDEMLISRVVRLHWDRAHTMQVKGAYQTKFKRDLINRIKGEISGDYQRTLVAMIN